jgi:hypothetical protein
MISSMRQRTGRVIHPPIARSQVERPAHASIAAGPARRTTELAKIVLLVAKFGRWHLRIEKKGRRVS